MEAINAARKEFSKANSKKRMNFAVKQSLPRATSKFSEAAIGDKVLIYRDPPIGK